MGIQHVLLLIAGLLKHPLRTANKYLLKLRDSLINKNLEILSGA